MIVRGQQPENKIVQFHPVASERTAIEYWYGSAMRENEGLGFLPVAAAAAPIPVVGPIIAVGAAVASAIASIFGFGGDDQSTNYRPPADAGSRFVHLDDQHGNEYVAYDVNQTSLAEAARRGNRADDVYSYYSAFSTGSTRAGASSAARNVIEDAAAKNGISIQRAADWILRTAGIPRLVQSFLPSGSGATADPSTSAAKLPGYCPAGTYHPYPIGHVWTDLCVPFPDSAKDPSGGQKTPGTGGQAPGNGQVYDPQTGQYITPPPCEKGTTYNPQTGRCEKSLLSQLLEANIGGIPWWLIIVAALVAMKAAERDDSAPPRRRRR